MNGDKNKPRPLAQNCLECQLYKYLICTGIGKYVQHPGRKICENQLGDEIAMKIIKN
jgi:hypothetical protein